MKSVESEIYKRILEIRSSFSLRNEENENENGGNENENDQHHLAFLFLDTELENRSLTSLDQLPIKGTTNVIQLVNSLPANPLLFAILQKINLTECLEFPLTYQNLALIDQNKGPIIRSHSRAVRLSPYLTGTGFDSIFDRSSYQENVFATCDLCYPSVIGFALPDHIKCERIGKIFNVFKVFRNYDSYIANRLNELKLPTGLQFKGNPKNGHNITHNKTYADIAFTYVREYRLFSLTIKPSAELNPIFVTRVKEISKYSVDEFFGLKQWEELFSTHGTHVIQSANGGGKIVITILENHLKTYFKSEELHKKEKEIEELLSNYLDWCEGETQNIVDMPLINSIKLYGGDTKFEHVDLTKCKDRIEIKCELNDWIDSLPFRPVMSDTVLTLESIPDILDRKGLSGEATVFDNAAKKLLGKSFRSTSKVLTADQKITRWSFW